MAPIQGPLTFATVGQYLNTPFEGACDLCGVSKIDSAGLALLLEMKRRAQARGVMLGFVQVPSAIHQLADHFGISGMLGLRK